MKPVQGVQGISGSGPTPPNQGAAGGTVGKLERLAAQVAAGSYTVDPARVADALIQRASGGGRTP